MQSTSTEAIVRLLVATAAGTVLVVALGVVFVELAFTNPRELAIADANKSSDVAVVTVSGNIYTKSENKFLLKDASGAAEIETCPPWFRKVILRDGEHVQITGEVLQTPARIPGAKYRIAAHRIGRKGEPDIVLRKTVGKPQWTNSEFIPNKLQ